MKTQTGKSTDGCIDRFAGTLRGLFIERWAMGLTTIATLTMSTPSTAAAPPELPTYYVQSDFRLPFDIGPSSRRPKQLDLLVSRDAGQSWRIHQSVAPTERAFEVAGANEGDYLLTVQARDDASSIISQRALRLVVDRTAPELNMECVWNGQQSLVIRSTITDKSLDFDHISLQYRCDNSAEYTPIAVELVSRSNGELVGSSVLAVPDCERFELLLSARDRAGNEGSSSQKFDRPASDSLVNASPVAQDARPATADEPSNASQPTMTLATHRRLPQSQGAQDVSLIAPQETLQLEFGLQPPAVNLVQSPLFTKEHTLSSLEPASKASEELTVKQRKFAVAYEIPSGAASAQCVELWGTEDSGATWQFWGHDEDRVSPCRIEVPTSGTYGYCIVVVRKQDDFELRPKSGDRPDLVVTVRESAALPQRATLSLIPTLEN